MPAPPHAPRAPRPGGRAWGRRRLPLGAWRRGLLGLRPGQDLLQLARAVLQAAVRPLDQARPGGAAAPARRAPLEHLADFAVVDTREADARRPAALAELRARGAVYCASGSSGNRSRTRSR